MDNDVQTDRLHVSALARQRLLLNHAGTKAEVVVHVFRIRAEHAAEVYSASDGPLERVAHVAGDVAAADAGSGADSEVEAVEI